MGQIEFPLVPNWQPLEMVVTGEKTRAAFMFIGTFVAPDMRIELYKHGLSRRYLNVDSAGNCYAYTGAKDGDEYTVISRAAALTAIGVEAN